jgi:16S rRNA (cytidine1402-2'-O)-methyltransferase
MRVKTPGTLKAGLYWVATPIGNLQDITLRALEILKTVDVILCEDTRLSGRLLKHYGIATRCLSYHAHNEASRVPALITALQSGVRMALISDAGTPGIADPGFVLARALHEHQIPIWVVPGACAAIAAVAISGFPITHFMFEGFLPAQSASKQKQLSALSDETRTCVFYEAPHRLLETLAAMVAAWGPDREVFLGQELTKQHERTCSGSVGTVYAQLQAKITAGQVIKGECVMVVRGVVAPADTPSPEVIDPLTVKIDTALHVCLREGLGVKQSVRLVAALCQAPKNKVYSQALLLKEALK